ncbi:hypothetical protein NLJ89_g3970 [Agrocybe chaxingu]|uniref:Uncharacterized protein n=1 Tax=Agrocybe chaxingu TaxID=84603 RepID=A0A9W8MUZ9_9AGAR|nr:hypothetical protein NLJ89_g3970 [Agrocybe chaxingu]
MTSRWVMVDDADPIVQYGSGWTAHSNVQDNPGNWGPPFDGTEHTTDRNTTVSLTFTGTSIIVLGKLDGNNATGRPDPYWDCSLDGEPIPRSGYSTSFTGHWIFCNRQNIPDGGHTFTLTTSTSGARTISVDQFQYLASPTINIDNAKVQIDTDSVRYSPGWESDSRYSHTYQTGASAVLDFVGISLQWYGFVPSISTANGPSTAGYKIDGGEEVNFTLAGIPAGSPAGGFSNVLMFETPRLSPGRHQLEVTHYGSSASTPLSVDYIFIQNATIPSGSSTSSSSSSTASGSVIPDSSSTTGSTSGSSSTTSTGTGLPINNVAESEKSTPVGAIVGGVIGGIACSSSSASSCYSSGAADDTAAPSSTNSPTAILLQR